MARLPSFITPSQAKYYNYQRRRVEMWQNRVVKFFNNRAPYEALTGRVSQQINWRGSNRSPLVDYSILNTQASGLRTYEEYKQNLRTLEAYSTKDWVLNYYENKKAEYIAVLDKYLKVYREEAIAIVQQIDALTLQYLIQTGDIPSYKTYYGFEGESIWFAELERGYELSKRIRLPAL